MPLLVRAEVEQAIEMDSDFLFHLNYAVMLVNNGQVDKVSCTKTWNMLFLLLLVVLVLVKEVSLMLCDVGNEDYHGNVVCGMSLTLSRQGSSSISSRRCMQRWFSCTL